MICRRCGTEHAAGTVGFKACCEGCGVWLHSCAQCRLREASSGRCRSMTTEPPGDPEGLNYCEEYLPRTDPPDSRDLRMPGERARERFRGLFGGKEGK